MAALRGFGAPQHGSDAGLQLNAAGLLSALAAAAAQAASNVVHAGGASALLAVLEPAAARQNGTEDAQNNDGGCSTAKRYCPELREAAADGLCALAAEPSARQTLADQVQAASGTHKHGLRCTCRALRQCIRTGPCQPFMRILLQPRTALRPAQCHECAANVRHAGRHARMQE